uniref:RNA-directed RNA polymerase n=1 Tax=Panagrellus redivivus TaxID=6233 RepID=A0A7E4WA42_PANRE
MTWFFDHIIENNVKTAVNSNEKVRCAPRTKMFEMTFGQKLVSAVHNIMYRMLVNLGLAEGNKEGCIVAQGQLNWASDWWFNICK